MSLTPAIDQMADEAWEKDHPIEPHFHEDSKGLLHACYHKCRHWLSIKWWLAFTGAFYVEHFITEKVPPLTYLTHWLGL